MLVLIINFEWALINFGNTNLGCLKVWITAEEEHMQDAGRTFETKISLLLHVDISFNNCMSSKSGRKWVVDLKIYKTISQLRKKSGSSLCTKSLPRPENETDSRPDDLLFICSCLPYYFPQQTISIKLRRCNCRTWQPLMSLFRRKTMSRFSLPAGSWPQRARGVPRNVSRPWQIFGLPSSERATLRERRETHSCVSPHSCGDGKKGGT